MLRLVAAVLIVWEPLRFAGEALQVLPSIQYRGLVAALELLVHGVVAAVSVGAGFALWNGTPDARRIGAIAVIGTTARALQSVYWSVLPSRTVPGDEPLAAAVALVGGAVMLVVIRVRAH